MTIFVVQLFVKQLFDRVGIRGLHAAGPKFI